MTDVEGEKIHPLCPFLLQSPTNLCWSQLQWSPCLPIHSSQWSYENTSQITSLFCSAPPGGSTSHSEQKPASSKQISLPPHLFHSSPHSTQPQPHWNNRPQGLFTCCSLSLETHSTCCLTHSNFTLYGSLAAMPDLMTLRNVQPLPTTLTPHSVQIPSIVLITR